MKVSNVISVNKDSLNFFYVDRSGLLIGDSIDVDLHVTDSSNLGEISGRFKDLISMLNDSMFVLDGYSNCDVELGSDGLANFSLGRGKKNTELLSIDLFDHHPVKISSKYFEIKQNDFRQTKIVFMDGSEDYWGFSGAYLESIRKYIHDSMSEYIDVEFSVVVSNIFNQKISRSVLIASVVNDSLSLKGYRNSITDSKNPYSVLNGLYLNDTIFIRDSVPNEENSIIVIDVNGSYFKLKPQLDEPNTSFKVRFLNSNFSEITINEIAELELAFLKTGDYELFFELGSTHRVLVKTAG